MPLDLLQFQPAHRPALLRTFGSHVIAATDAGERGRRAASRRCLSCLAALVWQSLGALRLGIQPTAGLTYASDAPNAPARTAAVAEELITRFGIPSVTPDGKLTSRGTLQGGWRAGGSGSGGAGGAHSPIHVKLSLDHAEQQLATVQQQAATAQAAMDATAQQLLRAQQRQDAAEAAAAELVAAEQEVQACRLQLAAQQAAGEDVQAHLGRLQAELAAKHHLLHSMQANGSDTAGSGLAAKAALQAELVRLATAATALEKEMASAAAGLAAAQGQVAALEAEQALCTEPGLLEELASCQRDLTAATAALLSRQTELAAQSAEVAAMQQAVERASAEVGAAEQATAAAVAVAAEQRTAAEQAAAEQQELQRQLELLLRDVPELGPLLQSAAGGSRSSGSLGVGSSGGGHGSTVAALKQSCSQLAQRRSKLLLERRGSVAGHMPLTEQLAFREQQAGLVAARRQAETLRVAAQRLQEGMAASDGQVSAPAQGWASRRLSVGRVIACAWGAQAH